MLGYSVIFDISSLDRTVIFREIIQAENEAKSSWINDSDFKQ